MQEKGEIRKTLNENEGTAVEESGIASMVDDMVYLSDLYLHKNYLQYLDKMPIVPVTEEIEGIKQGTNLRMIRIDGILHDKNENLSEKLKSLFGAVEAFEAGLMLVLQAKGSGQRFILAFAERIWIPLILHLILLSVL